MADEKRIMFEIYRESADERRYRVVYFTELGEHERETEIGNAARGDHVFDGFILSRERSQAKEAISQILERLNNGESIETADLERELQPFIPF
jgi:hypothetical protein